VYILYIYTHTYIYIYIYKIHNYTHTHHHLSKTSNTAPAQPALQGPAGPAGAQEFIRDVYQTFVEIDTKETGFMSFEAGSGMARKTPGELETRSTLNDETYEKPWIYMVMVKPYYHG